jgi:hypothetical protein
MTNACKSIQQGLTEAIAHAKTKDTKTTGVKLYQPHVINVSDLRQRLNMTQQSRIGMRANPRIWHFCCMKPCPTC